MVYIDREKFLERLKFKRDTDNIDRKKYAGLECAIAQCLKAPTEDVVPRSEVEEWKEIAEAYQKQFEESYEKHQKEIEELETKLHLAEEAFRVASENAESARDKARSIASKIFKEIEEILFYLNDFTINDIELEQPEQVGAEVICYEFQDKLETLRNKYIGE